MAQLVERILGKDEVISSTLISSSRSPAFEKGRSFVLSECKLTSETLHGVLVVQYYLRKVRRNAVRGTGYEDTDDPDGS